MPDLKDYYKKISPYLVYIYALVGGGILFYGFAPYNSSIAGLVSPAIFLWCLRKASPSKAFLIGFCYGIGMFGLGVNWVYVSIHDYGYTSAWLATLITALFVLFIALYPAVMAALLCRLFKQNTISRAVFVFPALWVLFEILRGWAFSGFPWLFVGYTQMSNILVAFAPVGGIFTVSYASVLISSLLFCIFDYFYSDKEKPKLRNKLILAIVLIYACAFGLNRMIWTVPTNQNLSVSLIQGNVAQLMRWDPAYVSHILQTYQRLTQKALTSNIVVWPEGAVPVPLPLSQHFFQEMSEIAKINNFALISGVPTQLPDQIHYYNSLYAVGMVGPHNKGCDQNDKRGCIYFKEHLVPFGEYVPFEKMLRGLIAFFNLPMSSFVPGPPNQSPLIAQGFRFAPAICYEIAYPLFVQKMSKNADFILTVSNDTWFGASVGPIQHLQIAQFRALETGKNVIRATNTGYTTIINPDGTLQATAPAFEEAVLSGIITVMDGETPWSHYGIWPIAIVLVLMLAIGFIIQALRKT